MAYSVSRGLDGCLFPEHHPCTYKGRQRNFASSQLGIIAVARSQTMVALGSPVALIIFTTMPDGPAFLPDFIFEMVLIFLKIVIGMGGPSSGGSLDWTGV